METPAWLGGRVGWWGSSRVGVSFRLLGSNGRCAPRLAPQARRTGLISPHGRDYEKIGFTRDH